MSAKLNNNLEFIHVLQYISMLKQDEPNYGLFIKWFWQNGGYYKKIKFPAYFPPTNYLGISAIQQINKNEVFLAVPKKLIITPQRIRKSKLGPILQMYSLLQNTQGQGNQFNVVILFIIWQKMLGKNSFYYPYIQALGKAETIICWSDEQIQKIDDPYITVDFVNQLRKQLPLIYQQFYQISSKNPQLFNQPITEQLFLDCYMLVTTRCFGWGLPQTMMVPFADFLNHNCNGVYHYVLNRKLQQDGAYKYQQQYIKKRNQLDLSILNIIKNQQIHQKSQSKRQQFIKIHYNILDQYIKPQQKQYTCINQSLQLVQKNLLKKSYDIDLYPSSNSQDNDSEQQQQQQQQVLSNDLKRKYQLRKLSKLAKQKAQSHFKQEPPKVNRQFESDIKFSWWNEMNEDDSYFIVAAHKTIRKNEQVFNSYGRRCNKFLLLYYGFTHINNKYDSVAFRFWSQEANFKTGKSIFAKYLTEKDWYQKIKLGNQRYSYSSVTDEYRLKKQNLCYELMAYLRQKLIKSKPNFNENLLSKKASFYKINDLKLQKLMLNEYQKLLEQVQKLYQTKKQRDKLSNKGRNYFAEILVQSNKQIIQNHFNGIKLLKKVIEQLLSGQKLLHIFQNCQILQQKIQQKSKMDQLKFRNRKFTLSYFKMLSQFIIQQQV